MTCQILRLLRSSHCLRLKDLVKSLQSGRWVRQEAHIFQDIHQTPQAGYSQSQSRPQQSSADSCDGSPLCPSPFPDVQVRSPEGNRPRSYSGSLHPNDCFFLSQLCFPRGSPTHVQSLSLTGLQRYRIFFPRDTAIILTNSLRCIQHGAGTRRALMGFIPADHGAAAPHRPGLLAGLEEA